MPKAVFEAEIEQDLLVGTSAGGVNAASIGQGFTASLLENLANIWSGPTTSDVFGRFGIRSMLRLLLDALLRKLNEKIQQYAG